VGNSLRHAGVLVIAGLALPAGLAAQSSMFGTRGVGFQGRFIGAEARGTGGSFGLFDGTSTLNPAALSEVPRVTVGFDMVGERRNWQTPAGNATVQSTRFPLAGLAGPVPKTPFWLGVSFSSYADQDYRLVTKSLQTVSGIPMQVFDTLQSTGGLNELRFATAYDAKKGTSLGFGFHLITGSDRVDARRSFEDTSFHSIRQTAEVSYSGVGFSLGLVQKVFKGVRFAALVRSDGSAKVQQDSTNNVTHIDLPYTFGAGLQFTLSKSLTTAAQAVYRTWSGANSDLVSLGGIGSVNTIDLSAGAEYLTNYRRPTHLPVRFGVRYAQLPFPLNAAGRPEEFTAAVGTGLRFSKDRAGVDLALENAWRRQQGDYKERAFMLSVGVTIVP
jgi:hypothetical protein